MSTVNDLERMEIDVYQRLTRATAVYPNADTGEIDALAYVTLGLAGEAGEIANKVKKIIRDNGGVITEAHRVALRAELGDVLWYAARMAHELDTWLSVVARGNLLKLDMRRMTGTIHGDGDER